MKYTKLKRLIILEGIYNFNTKCLSLIIFRIRFIKDTLSCPSTEGINFYYLYLDSFFKLYITYLYNIIILSQLHAMNDVQFFSIYLLRNILINFFVKSECFIFTRYSISLDIKINTDIQLKYK